MRALEHMKMERMWLEPPGNESMCLPFLWWLLGLGIPQGRDFANFVIKTLTRHFAEKEALETQRTHTHVQQGIQA